MQAMAGLHDPGSDGSRTSWAGPGPGSGPGVMGVEGGLCTPNEALFTAIDPIIVTGMGCTNRRIQFFGTNNQFKISVNFVISSSESPWEAPHRGPRGAGAGPAGAAVERRREGLGSPRGRAGAGAPLYGGCHPVKQLKMDVSRPKKSIVSRPQIADPARLAAAGVLRPRRDWRPHGTCQQPPARPLAGAGARGDASMPHSSITVGCGRTDGRGGRPRRGAMPW